MRPVLILAVAAALCSTPVFAANAELGVEIKGLAPGPVPGMFHLRVMGDVDGDGVADERVLRVQCDGSRLLAAALHDNVKSPRDTASGMASGKQAHGNGTASVDGSTNQWPTLPRLASPVLTPRMRISSVARTAHAGWSAVELSEPTAVCPALQQAAAAIINTSRSNIKQ